jgi:diguanylate cyclase (GGDEF)-like protein
MSEQGKETGELYALRSIVEASEASLAFFDTELRLVTANNKRLGELGLSESPKNGESLSAILAPEPWERCRPLLERCLAGEAQRFGDATRNGQPEQEVSYLPSRDGRGRVIGVVEVRVDRAERSGIEKRLADRELELANAIAELKRLTTTDSLSGALNRGAILAALEEEIRRSVRYERPLALILFDLDRFKLVNDIHGRAAGDEAIKRFSSICRASFRNTDYVGRYGGEEFLALLPEVGTQGAIEAAERVRTAMQSERFKPQAYAAPWGNTCLDKADGTAKKDPAACEEEFTVTASAGVVAWEKGSDSDRLLAAVDSALYRAKERGRNRVEAHARH